MSGLGIFVLGEMRVTRWGHPVALPPSRKTRALLAYLVLTDRPHRRERLCEMFWDLPDDPRGSLRWALSRLRGVLDASDMPHILADRERVAFSHAGVEVDLTRIRDNWRNLPTGAGLAALLHMGADLALPVLDGLDQPRSEAFQSWLVALREDVEGLWRQVCRRIVQHPDIDDHTAITWSRALLAQDPLCAVAADALSRHLRRLGRAGEADSVRRAYEQTAREAGVHPGPVPPQHDDRTGAAHTDGQVPRAAAPDPPFAQHIGFCTADDGVRIAYSTVGTGPPVVKAANWLNHLELDWQSPVMGKTLEALAARNTLIRYDERGNGLSDWDVPELSQAAFVRDLATVVDALGLSRFPLLGMSQGCAVSIDYAVRHPDRVCALILIGGYAAGWRISATPQDREQREAVMTLTRHGWGSGNPAYRHIFSQTFMPDAAPRDLEWFDEFQRRTTSPENAVRFQDAFGDIDVRHLLAQIRVPTLVLHARHDQRIPVDQGRHLAAAIPNARFVSLESRSHIILGDEPAWAVMIEEIGRFLAQHTRHD